MTAPGVAAPSASLVPGDPAAVGRAASAMRSRGDALHRTGAALARVDGTDGWAGPSADLFRSAFADEPRRWQEAGDRFHRVGEALDRFRAVLQWAQDRAADAARLAAEGTDEAVQAAEEMLVRAREQVAIAGDEAARAVEEAMAQAPDVRRWPEEVGGKLGRLASDAADSLAGFGEDVLRVAGDLTGVDPALPWDDPVVREKIPDEWGEGRDNRSGVGHRWIDPGNPTGTGVRIDQGDPNVSQSSQQVDHVVVRDNGRVIGRDGLPVLEGVKRGWERAHIPLEEWMRWRTWNHP